MSFIIFLTALDIIVLWTCSVPYMPLFRPPPTIQVHKSFPSPAPVSEMFAAIADKGPVCFFAFVNFEWFCFSWLYFWFIFINCILYLCYIILIYFNLFATFWFALRDEEPSTGNVKESSELRYVPSINSPPQKNTIPDPRYIIRSNNWGHPRGGGESLWR